MGRKVKNCLNINLERIEEVEVVQEKEEGFPLGKDPEHESVEHNSLHATKCGTS